MIRQPFFKSVNQSIEHYRGVTIDLFFGSTVNGVRQCAFVNVQVTIYCRSFFCSVIRLEKSLRFETDLSHLECSQPTSEHHSLTDRRPTPSRFN